MEGSPYHHVIEDDPSFVREPSNRMKSASSQGGVIQLSGEFLPFRCLVSLQETCQVDGQNSLLYIPAFLVH
jgi:hypothetical protein